MKLENLIVRVVTKVDLLPCEALEIPLHIKHPYLGNETCLKAGFVTIAV